MPVIEISKSDLEKLVGRDLSIEEIIDLLPRMKCEIERIEGDIIEYEATHDRPDLFSTEGLARSLKYFLGIGETSYKLVDEGIKAFNKGVYYRPYVAFAIVRNVELNNEAIKQIMQLQEKLATTYGRNRRKASIGVYDLDTIKLPVYYELADIYETRFTPLNETVEMNLYEIIEKTDKGREFGWIIKDYDKYPILRDSDGRILSLAPIINSEDTRVTENTRNIIIDSTGIDPEIVIDMVTLMALNIAERSIDRKIVYVETVMPDNQVLKAPRSSRGSIKISVREINRILGVKLDTRTIVDYLHKMGFTEIIEKKRYLEVKIPLHRLDIISWIDISEDIAIAYGYDRLGSESIELPSTKQSGRVHPVEYLSRVFRKILSSYNFIEVVNYIMSNPTIQLGLFNLDKKMITVSNPKMEKYTGLRIWLTPGLLETIIYNAEKEKEIRIFEIGDVVIPDEEYETGARTERRVGLAISHDKATLTDGLTTVTTILEQLGLKPEFRQTSINGFLEKRTASIFVDGVEIGFVGEIHPRILDKLGLTNPVVIAELSLNNLLNIISR